MKYKWAQHTVTIKIKKTPGSTVMDEYIKKLKKYQDNQFKAIEKAMAKR